MTAPPGGFAPLKAASPSTHPPKPSILWVTGRAFRNTACFCKRASLISRKGVTSSMIQMPRPWVARTRSCVRGCTAISRTATLGKLPPLNCAHVLPPSFEIHKPNSVPANRRLGLTVSSLITWAYPRSPCSTPAMRVHVLP